MPDEESSKPFPIVGIGASAGGLEAFTQLLRALPGDIGVGVVLVQHLAPTHASALAEILTRVTRLPVMEVHDQPKVEPNHVYVIPPGRNMVIARGKLQLIPRDTRGQNRPIDLFLRSLAEDQGYQAIGVILSGTATNGTLGCQDIKAAGGITFAQDDSAQQDSMPKSAIAAGCIDFVLPPEKIANELARIARHPYVALSPAPPAPKERDQLEPDLARVLRLLRAATGVDFALYRSSTVQRRITRRMLLNKIETLNDYARRLEDDPAEVHALYQDMLINVTSFFRDPEVFEALKTKVFPCLVRDKPRNEPLRAWVLGCSTGEEAYSVAMSFAEFAESSGGTSTLQIFATDLNAMGIEKARVGVYPKDIESDVAPERLRRFFSHVDGHYRIAKRLRDMCVFAQHNALSSPPFSRIDLISCRNLLIYLEPALQHKIVPILHYALKPAGFLMLGASETIGAHRDLFEPDDAKHKIFARKPGPGRLAMALARGPVQAVHEDVRFPRSRDETSGAEVQKEADRIVMAKYAPPGVVIDSDMEIVQFRGDTSPYLAPMPGRASLNLLRMAPEGLLVPLRAAVKQAKKEAAPAREVGLRVKADGGDRKINLQVIPLNASSEAGFLVLFEDVEKKETRKRVKIKPHAAKPEAEQDEIARLTQELAASREYIQSLIEQHEAANEELQSATEEAQSANEELQSINEELETSKEEIQSSNEELATVNDELNHRNLELGRLNSDLVNLIGSVQVTIVMLGQDLRIRRFTPMAEKTLNLIPADVGRPIGDIRLAIDIPNLNALLTDVIDTVSVKEREVQDRNGRWYALRIRPYKTLENKIDGAVLMLVDVDTLKRAHEYAETTAATVREPLVVLDENLRVRSASRSFYEIFHVSREETENRLLYDLGNRQWDIPALRRLLEDILPRENSFENFEVEIEFQHIGRKTMLLNARKLAIGDDPFILLAIEDITEHKQLEQALHRRVEELATADRRKNEFLAMLAHELRNPLAPLKMAGDILKNPAVDAATAERTREIMERQIRNMSRMIDDLLDASRITSGKTELRKEEVELNSILSRALQSVQHQIAERGQKIAVSLSAEPVYLKADPIRLEQVFGNLLHNASKFTSVNGHIELNSHLDTGQAVVHIRDEGIGISQEMLPHVFDLFAQGDRSLDRAQGGLGIGLTVVKSLVELHGGSVAAHSAGLKQGSEFVVRLPVSSGVERAAGQRAFVSPAAPRRILVVDDNVDAAESLHTLLSMDGHDVRTAHDGPAALEAAAAFQPEVVVLDIGLPGMNGYEVARRLRWQPGFAETVLIALTGYGQTEDRRLANEAGIDHHLTKPANIDAINELLGGSATS
ncbi:MAG: chemotaxis protein CheB [Burkholderiales bacterium]